MGIKDVFKKVWIGLKVADKYLPLIEQFIPEPFRSILAGFDALVNRAEQEFPTTGSGPERATFVSLKALAAAEIFTGKNVDNPKTRAIANELAGVVADIKNTEVYALQLRDKYVQLAKDLKDAIDSVKDPAQPDAPQP